MDNDYESAATRVTGRMLPQSGSSLVCLIGRVASVRSGGREFTLKCGSVEIVVRVAKPSATVSDNCIVEVCGRAADPSAHSFDATEVITFPEDQTETFDMEGYEEAVELLGKHRDCYAV